MPHDATPDIRSEATRDLASRALDLRLIPRAGGNFHPADVSVTALNDALATIEWDLSDTIASDAAVLECIPAYVQWLADRHRLPSPHSAEEHKELTWSAHRMLFAGLGHAHHAAIVEALQAVSAGCPWDSGETEREWQDNLLTARTSSNWPAVLLLVPWRILSLASQNVQSEDEAHAADTARQNPWWGEACILWHLIRHLRRSDQYGLVYTYAGRWGAMDAPKGTTAITTHNGAAAFARQLDLPTGASKKDAHPFASIAHDILVATNRTSLLSRKSLASLLPTVLASPAAAYVGDRARQDRFFQHGLGLSEVWCAEAGTVYQAANFKLSHDTIIGFDWNPTTIPAAILENQPVWKNRLVETYDAKMWPSDIFSNCFPNVKWRSLAHKSLFDAVALLSVMRNAHPILNKEYPLIILLPSNPEAGDSIRNGKTAATKAILNIFSIDAPTMRVGNSTASQDVRSTLVNIDKFGTVGLDEWRLPPDAAHPLSAPALAALATGNITPCGLVLSNVPAMVKLKHPLVFNAKTISLPVDLESRSVFVWLDQLSTEQTLDGNAYQAATSGQLGLRMRLAAVALAEEFHVISWLQTLDGGTTQDGSRFGLHRAAAAAVYSAQHNTDYVEALGMVDDAQKEMLRFYREHTDAAESSGLLELQESGRIIRLHLDHLFDVQPEAMGTYVESIRVCARNAHFTAAQLLRAVVQPYVGADPSATLGMALSRFTGYKVFEETTPRLLNTLLNQDMIQKMPQIGMKRYFLGGLGLSGWWMARCENESLSKAPTFEIGCDNPAFDFGSLRKRQKPLSEAVHSPNRGTPAST